MFNNVSKTEAFFSSKPVLITRLIIFSGLSLLFGYYAYLDENLIFGMAITILCLIGFDLADFAHIFPRKNGQKRSFWAFLVFLIIFRTFFYDVMFVPSGSMTPTLLTGEFILVKKCEYGFNSESMWPFGKFARFLPTVQWREPKRGEIVVWTRAHDKPLTFYVKRAVAIDGDSFQMVKGMLYINDQSSKVEKIKNGEILHDYGIYVPAQFWQETSPDGNTVRLTVRDREFGQAHSDNTPRYVVPKKHFVIVGDNRMHGGSHDSRDMSEYPPMPYSQVIGKAKFVVLSSNAWKDFKKDVGWARWIIELPYRFIMTFVKIRWDRMWLSVK